MKTLEPSDHPAPGVLIVDDEYFVARSTAAALKACGLRIVGMCGSSQKAVELLDDNPCDGVVLDVNLGADSSAPLARELVRRDIPFVVVSGYSLDQLEAPFDSAPALAKPFDPGELASKLFDLVKRHAQKKGKEPA